MLQYKLICNLMLIKNRTFPVQTSTPVDYSKQKGKKNKKKIHCGMNYRKWS